MDKAHRQYLKALKIVTQYRKEHPEFIEVNLDELNYLLTHMTTQQNIYKVLKDYFTEQRHWRVLPRGNPLKGFKNGWGKTKKEF